MKLETNWPECTALRSAKSRWISRPNMSPWALATARSPSESMVILPKKRLAARSAMMPNAARDSGSNSSPIWRMKICLVTLLTSQGMAPPMAEVSSMQNTASTSRPHWRLT